MREGTSGVWVTKKDGVISIGYEDYGVSEFGGGDFEKTYYLDKENAKKFEIALKKKYFFGSLKSKVKKAFGENFRDPDFWKFCKENGIKYTYSTWSG